MTGLSYTATTETVHGLLRPEGPDVTGQWRVARKTEEMKGDGYHTDEELEQVREVTIPISALAGAIVRRPWWKFWASPCVVLIAPDLQVLDALAGEEGLALAYPAELVLPVRRRDALLAAEFAAELELAVAEDALAAPDAAQGLLEEPPEPG
jgi:hypothetical protein